MIPGRGRDDAPPALLGVELAESITRPANLERARALEILGLEVDLDAELLGKMIAQASRRRTQVGGENLGGGFRLGGNFIRIERALVFRG